MCHFFLKFVHSHEFNQVRYVLSYLKSYHSIKKGESALFTDAVIDYSHSLSLCEYDREKFL